MTAARTIRRTLLAGLAAATAWAPAHANAARLGGGEDLHVSLWRIVVALLVAILIVVLAALLIRQRGGKFDLAAFAGRMRLKTSDINVVETRRLSPHADLCLIRHRDREYLLLLGAGHGRILNRADLAPDGPNENEEA